jgi:hypothetical protein
LLAHSWPDETSETIFSWILWLVLASFVIFVLMVVENILLNRSLISSNNTC